MTNDIQVSLNRLLKNLGSDKSRRAYEDDWARYTTWLGTQNLQVTEVKPKHIEDHITWLQGEGNKRTTCGRALSVIRSVYGVLVRDELLAANPAREVKNPKFDSALKTPWLNEDQVKQLLSFPIETWEDRRNHLALRLLFGLGWRRSEVARMRVEDLYNGTITGVVKGSKTLTVGVPAWLMTAIEQWCQYAGIRSGALLPRAEDDPSEISDDMLYKIVKNAAKRVGLPKEIVTPHALRRTNITLAGKRGVPLKQRQLAVGHESIVTSEKYDRARDAASNAPGQVFEDLVK